MWTIFNILAAGLAYRADAIGGGPPADYAARAQAFVSANSAAAEIASTFDKVDTNKDNKLDVGELNSDGGALIKGDLLMLDKQYNQGNIPELKIASDILAKMKSDPPQPITKADITELKRAAANIQKTLVSHTALITIATKPNFADLEQAINNVPKLKGTIDGILAAQTAAGKPISQELALQTYIKSLPPDAANTLRNQMANEMAVDKLRSSLMPEKPAVPESNFGHGCALLGINRLGDKGTSNDKAFLLQQVDRFGIEVAKLPPNLQHDKIELVRQAIINHPDLPRDTKATMLMNLKGTDKKEEAEFKAQVNALLDKQEQSVVSQLNTTGQELYKQMGGTDPRPTTALLFADSQLATEFMYKGVNGVGNAGLALFEAQNPKLLAGSVAADKTVKFGLGDASKPVTVNLAISGQYTNPKDGHGGNSNHVYVEIPGSKPPAKVDFLLVDWDSNSQTKTPPQLKAPPTLPAGWTFDAKSQTLTIPPGEGRGNELSITQNIANTSNDQFGIAASLTNSTGLVKTIPPKR